MYRLSILLGAGNAALAIILGAFAAHALEDSLSARMLSIFQTAVDYHLYHALGLIVVGILMHQFTQNRLLNTSMVLMLVGIILFCGSLYILSISGKTWLGAITPFGGLSFIISWLLVFLAFLNTN